MTPAERNRRKRRLKKAGFEALPSGWVPAAYAEEAARKIQDVSEDVEAAAAMDLPRGRPPRKA